MVPGNLPSQLEMLSTAPNLHTHLAACLADIIRTTLEGLAMSFQAASASPYAAAFIQLQSVLLEQLPHFICKTSLM